MCEMTLKNIAVGLVLVLDFLNAEVQGQFNNISCLRRYYIPDSSVLKYNSLLLVQGA